MAGFNEDRERQVVPRWRSFMDTKRFGELAPLRKRPSDDFNETMLQEIADDWKVHPTPSVAADFVSAAFAVGKPEVARDAAEYILRDGQLPGAAIELARRCVSPQQVQPRILAEYSQPNRLHINEQIHYARARLSQYPLNPVLWTNLALFYTTIGQSEKADRAIRIALQFAKENRFVVRAACRLYLHHGDRDHAHDVLRQSPLLKRDPWVLAGEIAVSATKNVSSQFIRIARRMVDSQNYSPFHLSELAGAIATIEACSGNIRKARPLLRFALTDPAENSLAQAAWLSRRIGGFSWHPSEATTIQSSEANAWAAFNAGNWTLALSESVQWQADQSFSSRPAMLGSYLAATTLEDYAQAARIAQDGLMSNREDPMLYNNLAFALARSGDVEGARLAIQQAKLYSMTEIQRVCLTATEGLVEYRSSNIEQGRSLYLRAIELAKHAQLDEHRWLATIHLLLEEMRVTADKTALQKQGLEAVEKVQTPIATLLRRKFMVVPRVSE